MYIYIGNNSGPWTLVRIVEVSVIGGVRFRRFHCISLYQDILESGIEDFYCICMHT